MLMHSVVRDWLIGTRGVHVGDSDDHETDARISRVWISRAMLRYVMPIRPNGRAVVMCCTIGFA